MHKLLLKIISPYLNLSRQDDGNDESIDGDCLAENDRDQVLGFNPWSLHTSTNDAEKDTNIKYSSRLKFKLDAN